MADFLTLFQEYGVSIGVDVRSFPTSRFPYFNKESLQQSFASQGIRYIHLGKELGGFRKGGYVAYLETPSFKQGLKELEEIGRAGMTAIFCSEKFSWKCHRRWISGALIQRGWKVIHIIESGKIWIPRKKDSRREEVLD